MDEYEVRVRYVLMCGEVRVGRLDLCSYVVK